MPTSSFFTSEQKIPIDQKKVSVRAENGLSYKLGQQINFVIPGDVGYMMPQETYLRMDVKIASDPAAAAAAGTFTRLQLDGETGANVLIRDVRISSGGAQNVLLEEIQNANILTSLKYDYETNETLRSKRAITEGALDIDPSGRGTFGSEDSIMCNHKTNPYYDEFGGRNGTTAFADTDFETVKCLLKIPGGIFNNDKVFPLGLTEGLRIEILLENQTNVFRQLDSVIKDQKLQSNPRFHSLDGAWSPLAPWVAGVGVDITEFYVSAANHFGSLTDFPFVIGESVGFHSVAAGHNVVPYDPADAATPTGCVITGLAFDQTPCSASYNA